MDLRKSLFILPNLFTVSSIFCGFNAIRVLSTAESPAVDPTRYQLAALLLVFAMFFDIIDGRVARLTRTQSAFGLQFDSLADVISFGIAPALLAWRWALSPLGDLGIAACFVYVACGAIRLARFNVIATRETAATTGPGKYIVGLPIPGAAGMLIALVLANHSVRGNLFAHPAAVAVLMVSLSALMVSTVQFRSFKDVRLTGWRPLVIIAAGVTSTALVGLRWARPSRCHGCSGATWSSGSSRAP
jgi:CDP-diacylglycerol--serine O-phosphatidyltransferase